MSTTARAIFQAHIDGDPIGDFPIQVQWFINPANGQRQTANLSLGNRAFTSPAFPSIFVLVPPTNFTGVLTLKGVNGDTGIPLFSSQPSVLPLSGSTSFVIASDSNVSVEYAFI